MKPMFFKTQHELIQFLEHAPRPDGQAKVQNEDMDASQILERCIALVPNIFDYRKALAKGPKGLGNYKSFDRYAEIASDAVSMAKLEAYEQAVDAIATEVGVLLEMGGGSELAQNLKQARTQVAAFTMIKESIEGFRDKLNKYMDRVEEAYAELATQLKLKRRELKGVLANEEALNLMLETAEAQHRSTMDLIEAMNEYCALQVGYAGLCAAGR